MLNIKETILAFQNLKVLIVGDVMLDAYLYGKMTRISPEAPVPIVEIEKKETRPGGAANVALNIQALGAKPILCSVIGRDKEGEQLKKILAESEISTKYLQVSTARRTTVKTRVLAQNQQILRYDEEDVVGLNTAEKSKLKQSIKDILEEFEIDVILFQDYNKGVLQQKVIRELLLIAIKKDIPTVVDPKNNNFFAYKRTSLFKPNLKEINTNLPFQSAVNLADLTAASNHIQSELKNTNLLITLSDKGIFYDDGNTQEILATNPRNIADVCGAGDSVISVAALGIALKLPLKDIATLANLAGGQVCEKVGVVPVSARELEEDYLDLIVKNGR